MKNTFLSFLIPFVLGSSAFCQNKLTGKIYDSQTNEPLVGASVVDNDTRFGVITNFDGWFELQTSANTDSIVVSYIGYEKQTLSISGNSFAIALVPVVNNLQQIVVTANREASLRTESPIAISKVSPVMINDTKPVLITELINKIPGVVMLNYNNEQHAMSIRQPMGTSAYFLYLEDGLPVRPMGIFNHNALIEMNVFGISSIEVVKGPASSLYGPEAVGGAINFITHRPTAIRTLKIGVQGDQWGYKRLQYGAGGMAGKKLGVYISGFEAKQTDAWQAYSDYKKSSFNARAEYLLSDRTKLVAAFSGIEYNSDMAGSVDSIAFYKQQYSSTTDFTYRKVHSQRTRFTISHQWNDQNETLVTVAYRDNYIEQNPNYAIRWTAGSTTASGEQNRNSFSSKVALIQHTIRFNFLDAKLMTGATIDRSPTNYWSYRISLAAKLREDGKSVEQYSIVEKQPENFISNYQADLKNDALYSQLELNAYQRLKVTLGLRYDKMAFDYINNLDETIGSKSFEQFTPKIGATFDLLRDKGLYMNYSTGFSPPGLTSIFRKRPGTSADFYYNLEPAQFKNIEVGAWGAFFENKLYLDLALYQMIGRKELLNIRQQDNSTDYQSAGKTLHRGIEYSLTYRPDDEWIFRFGGTNAIHRFEEFELSARSSDDVRNVNGNEMPQSPRWIANSEVTYRPSYLTGFRLSLEWQRISSWYQNQVNTVKYDDKSLFRFRGVSYLNLRAGYVFKSFEVFSNVTNLTDELYANAATRGNNADDRTTFTPAAPRTFVFGIQYTLAAKK